MRYFLGVDVGGTKCHALIADETGRVVGFGASGPGSYEVIGWDGLRQALRTVTDRALAFLDDARTSEALVRVVDGKLAALGRVRSAGGW